MGEFDLIARYFKRPAQRAPLGVGDDCALLAVQPGMQLAVSTDLLVEGRHFLSTVAPERLGHKALAVNLSDLAACGASPLAYTLSLSMPMADENFLAPFARGLHALADQHGVELVGGDTTAGPLVIGITVFGEVPAGQALLRSGARAGDDIWVSGVMGDARLALEVFRGAVALDGGLFDGVRRAMELPAPRNALGVALRGVASSAIDLSDGLSGDLGHILAQSRVGARITLDALPRSRVLAAQPEELQRRCLVSGGDDYELLFTAPAGHRDRVQTAARGAGTAITRIGTIEAETGLRIMAADGEPIDLAAHAAFDHFKA